MPSRVWPLELTTLGQANQTTRPPSRWSKGCCDLSAQASEMQGKWSSVHVWLGQWKDPEVCSPTKASATKSRCRMMWKKQRTVEWCKKNSEADRGEATKIGNLVENNEIARHNRITASQSISDFYEWVTQKKQKRHYYFYWWPININWSCIFTKSNHTRIL